MTDRRLPMGHNVLFSRQIARDPLHTIHRERQYMGHVTNVNPCPRWHNIAGPTLGQPHWT